MVLVALDKLAEEEEVVDTSESCDVAVRACADAGFSEGAFV